MAVLQASEKYSHTPVYAPLFRRLDALPSNLTQTSETVFGR